MTKLVEHVQLFPYLWFITLKRTFRLKRVDIPAFLFLTKKLR